MTLFNNTKNTFLFIFLPLVILIITSLIINAFANKNNNLDLNTESNKFLPRLTDATILQIKKDSLTSVKDTYSASFFENDFERKLILINKTPTNRAFTTNIIIHVFPKNKKQYAGLKNYNKEGYLGFTTKTKPILHTDATDVYSVLGVNIPFIDIEKIFVLQHGIWKQTFEQPFEDITPNIKSDIKTVTNNDLYQPVLHQLLREYDISYIPYKTAHFPEITSEADYIKTTNATIGIVKNKTRFWALVSNNNVSFLKQLSFKGEDEILANNLLTDYSEGKHSFSEVFDIEKLATYYAIINLFSNNENKEIGFIYNTQKNILEPIYLNNNKAGVLNTYIKDEKIASITFLQTYAQKLEEMSAISIDELIKDTPLLSEQIKELNTKDPSLLFISKKLYHNTLVLKKGINPSTAIKVEFLNINTNRLKITVNNLGDFPIEITGLNYKKKKEIVSYTDKPIILSRKKDTITIELPRSFENLFVHKKKKTTGFIFEKNIADLMITYNIIGLNKINYTDIIPYQPIENYTKKNDLFRQKIALSAYPFLKIDTVKNSIHFNESVTLSIPLILPKNYAITAKPGITINIINGGKFISYSPLNFIGTKENPIKIISEDKEGQGLLILANGKKSNLKYVQFSGLTNPSHGMWSTSSAITFYESPVNIDYCRISDNSCEDALNIVRSDFTMTNTYFLNIQSDAFDGDFVKGVVNSCVFQNVGNDAIDVSGSNLNISNTKIINAGDKGISVGENSIIIAKKVSISDCEIAVAGKDLSTVILNDINIKNTKLGFTAFQKKPEFGASSITATDVKMENVETNYLIENTSLLVVDNDTIITKQADVKSRMYGVEFGVSSKETKNRKK